MNHSHKGKKFGRRRGARRAFIKSLSDNLIMRGRIVTTEARAKALRPAVERLVTEAKKQNLAAFRRLLSKTSKASAEKLYYELSSRYKNRHGGYLKISRTELSRKRDGSPRAIIEFV